MVCYSTGGGSARGFAESWSSSTEPSGCMSPAATRLHLVSTWACKESTFSPVYPIAAQTHRTTYVTASFVGASTGGAATNQCDQPTLPLDHFFRLTSDTTPSLPLHFRKLPLDAPACRIIRAGARGRFTQQQPLSPNSNHSSKRQLIKLRI